MPQSDDESLVDLEARLERDDPRFARALATGRPAPPREYRHTGTWWALAAGTAMLVTGVVLADGLLIATGLVVSGIAMHMIDPDRVQRRRRGTTSR